MSVYPLLLFLLYLIIIPLTILFLIILFPLNVSFLSSVDGFIYDAKMEIGVLLGLFNGSTCLLPSGGSFKLSVFSFPIYSTKWTRREKEPDEKTVEKTIDKPQKRKRDQRILIRPIKRLFDSSRRIIKVKKLDVSLVTGLSDPYVSGLIFGVVFPFIEMMRIYFPQFSFSLTPVFVEERFSGKGMVSVSLRMILFVVPLLRFFLSKEFLEYRK